MTLIFGKLTGSFVGFATVVSKLQLTPSDPDLIAQLAEQQAILRHVSALDSLYLTLIGIGMFVTTYIFVSSRQTTTTRDLSETDLDARFCRWESGSGLGRSRPSVSEKSTSSRC